MMTLTTVTVAGPRSGLSLSSSRYAGGTERKQLSAGARVAAAVAARAAAAVGAAVMGGAAVAARAAAAVGAAVARVVDVLGRGRVVAAAVTGGAGTRRA